MRLKLTRNSRPHQILKYLAIGAGILVLSSVSPLSVASAFNSILKNYFRRKKFQKQIFFQDIKRLQTRKLVDSRELKDKNIEIRILKRGKNLVMKYNLDEIQLNKNIRWDGRWRLVMFDIPHSKRKARDELRQKLKELEFYHLQKSVFISPYPCENEIDFIGNVFNVRQNILLLYISHFEGEEKLKYHFKLV